LRPVRYLFNNNFISLRIYRILFRRNNDKKPRISNPSELEVIISLLDTASWLAPNLSSVHVYPIHDKGYNDRLASPSKARSIVNFTTLPATFEDPYLLRQIVQSPLAKLSCSFNESAVQELTSIAQKFGPLVPNLTYFGTVVSNTGVFTDVMALLANPRLCTLWVRSGADIWAGRFNDIYDTLASHCDTTQLQEFTLTGANSFGDRPHANQVNQARSTLRKSSPFRGVICCFMAQLYSALSIENFW
jgi:hypothetical protein